MGAEEAAGGSEMTFDTLLLTIENHIATVTLNRPDKANSLNEAMWQELRLAMEHCSDNPAVRVVILQGNGKHFCAGIDLQMLMNVQAQIEDNCEARKREKLRKLILALQASVSSLEACSKPVIAAIHGACVGGALDIILAADMRYASADARFCIKEVDVGMVADVGTLQRLARVVGEGNAREMAFAAIELTAEQAAANHLLNRAFESKEAMLAHVQACATAIAAKSPLAIRGTKEILNYSRDHSVADGLNYVATWNAAMLVSEDLQAAVMGAVTGAPATFRD